MKGLWLRLTCNWFVVGLHCAIRGHDYGVQYCGRTHRLFVCRWCGDFRGQQRIASD